MPVQFRPGVDGTQPDAPFVSCGFFSEEQVYEYACHEANYAMIGVLRGARLLESEWVPPEAGEASH